MWSLLSELYGYLTLTRGSSVVDYLAPQVALKAGGAAGAVAACPGGIRGYLDPEVVEEAICDVVTDYCGGGFDLGLVNDVYGAESRTLFPRRSWEGVDHPSYDGSGDPTVYPPREDYVAARRRLVGVVAAELYSRGLAGPARPLPDGNGNRRGMT